MSRSVLLLRAVNVSGRNSVPMARLREVLAAETDLVGVSTYIASGNIICEAPKHPEVACGRVRTVIHEEFGVDTRSSTGPMRSWSRPSPLSRSPKGM